MTGFYGDVAGWGTSARPKRPTTSKDPLQNERSDPKYISELSAYTDSGMPRNAEAGRRASDKYGVAFRSDYLNDPNAPAIGAANLKEYGPMRMQQYGPGQMAQRGPGFTMSRTGSGFTMGGSGPGRMGYGDAFRGMMPGGMGMGGGMMGSGMESVNPAGSLAGGGPGISEQDGMHPLEKAYLIAAAAGGVADIYGGYQEGKARDREFEAAEREREDRRERRKSSGRTFGRMFREGTGG